VEIASLLLEHGADVFAVADEGNSCLHWAAAAAETIAAKAERDHFKCDCKLRHEAEEHSHEVDHSKTNCIALLIDHGLDPTAENDEGLTPLAVAVAAGHEDVVAELLALAHVKSYKPAVYATILMRCKADSSTKALQLVSNAFEETRESLQAWDELLIRACLSSNADLARLALEKGACPAPINKGKPNPLMVAVVSGQVTIVDMLLAHGADLGATREDGKNALHLASSHPGHDTLTVRPGKREKATIASYLIEDGIRVNSRTPTGDTALHFAASTGDDALVRTLLRLGASVHVRNAYGSTPLHAAVSTWLFSDIIAMLLNFGASPSAQDHRGQTPLHLIRPKRTEDMEAVDMLLRNRADHSIPARNGDRPIHCAVKRKDWKLLKRLLDAGASINDRGANGQTVLHIAARRKLASFVEALMELGANVQIADADGMSPMQLATGRGHQDVLRLLLRRSETKT
jgi:ankyrin